MARQRPIPSPLHVRLRLLRHEVMPVLTFVACTMLALFLAKGMMSSSEEGSSVSKSGKVRPASSAQPVVMDSKSNVWPFGDR